MKIVFFGGSGFLGSHVCDKLSDAGHDVTIVDLRPSPYLRPDQKMVTGSLLDEDLVNTVVSGADAVFDFAGLADIGESNQKPVETARINVLGNVILLEACRKAGVKRYVFASTLYVYGKSGGFYRCSKQACELYIENYHDMFGLEYTILRYGSLYGPRADRRNAINRFVAEALEKGTITYYGAPTALREYIHVEDAALSTVEILGPEYANQNIVLTGNQPMQVGDLFRMIEEGQHREEIVNAGFDSEVVEKIHGMIMRNEKKRYQFPPVLRLSSCTFGHERLMPLTNKYGD